MLLVYCKLWKDCFGEEQHILAILLECLLVLFMCSFLGIFQQGLIGRLECEEIKTYFNITSLIEVLLQT